MPPADAAPALPVAGIKYSSGEADRLAQLLHDHKEVYVGSPNLLSTAGPCGAHGAQRELLYAHGQSMRDFPASLKPRQRL